MAHTGTFETTINLGGLRIAVEAEYEVTSWGAPASDPSFSGPGESEEPPEFHVKRVVALDTGLDLTEACNRPSIDALHLSTVYVPDPGQDPIRAILFGLETASYEPVARVRIIEFSPYRREIWNHAGTILEGIECEIISDGFALTPPSVDEFLKGW